MTFVSHAQNYEDVMLWRALKHLERGFYVDIGAAWPDRDSVTHAFYARGWRGVNVEPNPALHELLNNDRTEDLNLQVAVGDVDGSLPISILSNPGLSTLDPEIALEHCANGMKRDVFEVAVVTLDTIWHQHIKPEQDVHFLKLDVEGFEARIIKSANWEVIRPWIVVVESTKPMSQIECHLEWEHTLVEAGYSPAYADGLNRFYVAHEHPELLPCLQNPPNVFDDFASAGLKHAEAEALAAEERARATTERLRKAEQQLSASEEKVKLLEKRAIASEERAIASEERAIASEERAIASEERTRLAVARVLAVEESISWKITFPARFVISQTVTFFAAINRCLLQLRRAPSRMLRASINECISFEAGRLKLFARLDFIAAKVAVPTDSDATDSDATNVELDELSGAARRVHHLLSSNIKNKI